MTTLLEAENDFAGPSGVIAGHSEAALFDFDPEAWVELAYPCEMTHRRKEGTFTARFTEGGFRDMVENFQNARAEDPEFSLLVNVDHLALSSANKTEAAGWLVGLKIGEDGHLYGKFKWTSLGSGLAVGGIYRFVSVEVEDTRTPRSQWPQKGAEWNRITGVAITNLPALEDLRPFCHRAEPEPIEEKPETQPKGPNMEKIKQMLGLAPEATEDDVAAAIQALLDKQAAAEMEKKEQEVCRAAEAFAKTFGDRFTDEAAAQAFYRANPENADTLAQTIRLAPKPEEKPPEKPITHRRAGTPDDGRTAVSLEHYRSLGGAERRKYRQEHKAELMRLEAETK